MKTKKLIYGTLILIIVLILTNLASAARIGISPSQINFKNVLRGGYSERTITITTDSLDETEVEVMPRGEISNWLNFSKKKFKVTKDKPYLLTISTSPPIDSPNGNYTGYIRVKTSQTEKKKNEGQATSTVLPVLDLFTIVQITDQEVLECKAKNFKVNSVEEGDKIIFSTNIRNLGNTRINPQIKIDIWDSNQLEILKSETFSEVSISPTTEKEILIYLDSDNLEIGQYWVEISALDCYSTQTLTFDILEEGALKASGILQKILSNAWIFNKETTNINVFFENNGEKNIEANFKGKITLGERTIQLLESEKTLVLKNKKNIFEFFFTPVTPGRYVVSGRVYYSNKKTFEKSTIINVKPTGLTFKLILTRLIYLILVIGILILLFKIRKEKSIYQKKLRRLKR